MECYISSFKTQREEDLECVENSSLIIIDFYFEQEFMCLIFEFAIYHNRIYACETATDVKVIYKKLTRNFEVIVIN